MSEAKVLTEKQKRASLSNLKKKKKAPLRNVYVHPRFDHWPVLIEDDERIITDLIKGLFPAARQSTKSVCKDASESKASKRKRSSASSCEEASSALQEKDNVRSELVIGLREVIVAIEHYELKCLLLAREVDPPFLGQILGNLARASNVPFVTISNFRQLFEELLGFKSWCVGFKDCPNGYFAPLYEKVLSLINEPQKLKFKTEPQLISKCHPEAITKQSKLTPKPTSLANLHLYRTDKTKRVFVPKNGSGEVGSTSASFLGFSEDDTGNDIHLQNISGLSHRRYENKADTSKQHQSQRYFEKAELLPLQVKRFQGNPNKLKWRKDFRNIPKQTQENMQK